MRTALGRAARAAGSCAHWLGNGGGGTRSSSIGRTRARHRLWRWHHSSCTGRAGRAERLCSGRRHFGAIRSSGARTHRHRRVTASRGDIRRCRTLQNAALARPRRRCPAWAVSSVAAGGAPLRAMRLATGFPEARGTPRAPPVPPASSPGAHFAKAAIGSSKNITPRQEHQIKAAGGKGMGSAGGAARRCARGS